MANNAATARSQTDPDAPLLSIEGVSVELPTPRGNLTAVDAVSLTLAAGRTLGIVGESGSGKTMLSRADRAAVAAPGEVPGARAVRR